MPRPSEVVSLILSIALASTGLLALSRDGMVFVGVIAVIAFLLTSTRRVGRRCPRCRENNRREAIFCAQCGGRLPNR